MNKLATTLSLIALLAACDNEQPFTFADPEVEEEETEEETPEEEIDLSTFTDNGTDTAIPLDLANDLVNVAFTPGSQTITVTGNTLDTTPLSGTYTRNASLDIPGYVAYSVQEDNLDRMFVALLAESADGSVEGGTIIDGGQFGTFFGGAFYRRNDAYSAYVPSQPDQGLVTYTGEYAGLTNQNFPRSGSTDVLPLPASITDDNPIAPRQPDMVVGTVFINADFSDSVINGSIVDRALVGRGTAQPDLNLDPATITADGTFLGTVTRSMDQQGVGTYGGAFGGTQATGVAGAVEIADYLDDVDNEEEYGAFVLMRCGLPGEGALCASVDP